MLTIKNLVKLTFFLLTLLPLNSYSALHTADLYVQGDGLVTYDDVSGLRWMDLTETRNMSYNEVNSERVEGGSLHGWRYATYEETADIYRQFGFTVDIAGNDLSDQDFVTAVNLMASYFGDLYADYDSPNLFGGSQGMIGEPGQYYPDSQSMMYAFYQQYEYQGQTNITTYQMLGGNNWDYYYEKRATKGSFLVETPLPGAIYFFMSSIIAVFGIKRMKA